MTTQLKICKTKILTLALVLPSVDVSAQSVSFFFFYCLFAITRTNISQKNLIILSCVIAYMAFISSIHGDVGTLIVTTKAIIYIFGSIAILRDTKIKTKSALHKDVNYTVLALLAVGLIYQFQIFTKAPAIFYGEAYWTASLNTRYFANEIILTKEGFLAKKTSSGIGFALLLILAVLLFLKNKKVLSFRHYAALSLITLVLLIYSGSKFLLGFVILHYIALTLIFIFLVPLIKDSIYVLTTLLEKPSILFSDRLENVTQSFQLDLNMVELVIGTGVPGYLAENMVQFYFISSGVISVICLFYLLTLWIKGLTHGLPMSFRFAITCYVIASLTIFYTPNSDIAVIALILVMRWLRFPFVSKDEVSRI